MPDPQLEYHEACENPKVSVVVPIYNVEDYLDQALGSLAAQTLDQIEFICINDGSTDGSLAILEEYARKDGRFRVFDGPNGGYGKGMNRGIEAARGEYLGILEPDDFVPPEMFGDLYEIAVENDADIVKADFYRFTANSDGSLNKKLFKLSPNKSYYNRVFRPIDDMKTFQFVINTWSGIYKLDFLERWHIRHNETPGASYQDNGFWFQTFCRAERVMLVDKPYYMNRRDNPNSSMFSSGKMFCVTEEYRFIKEWMDRDPELAKIVEPTYYQKKFSNFMVTYRRLSMDLQREYLHHIRDEFAEPFEKGLLDEKIFPKLQWLQLNEILEDPDGFHDKLRVSVVMPVYNAESCLRQTLDGLLVRNETTFEVICVDDGSTDGSLAILREYEEADSRVHVVTQENAGAGAARNNGMEYARGEYLAFLDADDIYDPSMLRTMYNKAHLDDADIVVCRSDQYLEDKGHFAAAGYTIKEELLPKKRPFSAEEVEKDIFKAFVGWPWDKLFKASFVREKGLCFQELRTTNDMLFVFSAVVSAERITTVNDVLAHHRRASGSLSVTREKSWWCFHEALLALRAQLVEWGMFERRERDFVNYCLHSSLWNLNSLRGDAYGLLYDKLKDEWFEELGLAGREDGYFYHPDELAQMKKIASCDASEFREWREKSARRSGSGSGQQDGAFKAFLRRCLDKPVIGPIGRSLLNFVRRHR